MTDPLRTIRAVATTLVAAVAVGLAAAAAQSTKPEQAAPTGYDDTPMLPGGKWHVHDGARPRPPVVSPGTGSRQDATATPPSDAIVLFDGKDLSKWQTVDGGPAKWKVADGYVEVVAKAGDIATRDAFGDCQFHIEWAAPNPPHGNSQERGNSGVFLMGRYEIQVLDSFDNVTYADGQAGAIYGQWPPLVNASRPPGEWQTYDIVFTAPRFKDGRVETPAYVTVLHNGLVVQNHQALLGTTAHKIVGTYTPHPPAEPLRLQDHGNPVRYRNIWIRKLSNGNS
jgi:hypothetical protein